MRYVDYDTGRPLEDLIDEAKYETSLALDPLKSLQEKS